MYFINTNNIIDIEESQIFPRNDLHSNYRIENVSDEEHVEITYSLYHGRELK